MGAEHEAQPRGAAREKGERRLRIAVGANLMLTAAQIAGSVYSGSLALAADALHNFSDAASLLVALFAIRLARRPPDETMTYGYKRAETVAALVNLTTLVLVGLFLGKEAVERFFEPRAVEGWTVVSVTAVALVVDALTAALTFAPGKSSMNLKAVFLHNLSDALASVGVIVSGALILSYGWHWADPVMTLIIAVYILWQAFAQAPGVVRLLMEGTPVGVAPADAAAAMRETTGAARVYHLHLWQVDEDLNALTAHVVLEQDADGERVRREIRALLKERFQIDHVTLELEAANAPNADCAAERAAE